MRFSIQCIGQSTDSRAVAGTGTGIGPSGSLKFGPAPAGAAYQTDEERSAADCVVRPNEVLRLEHHYEVRRRERFADSPRPVPETFLKY